MRNIDSKMNADNRCDFWLLFENGVRLFIEMQDHLEADMEGVPPSQLPKWLRKKIEQDEKKLQDAASTSDLPSIG